MFSSNSFDVYTRLVILKSLHITLDSTTLPGHLSDRTFFATPVMVRFSSLLSVINIDSLFVCLPVALLSFILLLYSGKLPLRRAGKMEKNKV